jgi:anti-sigma B factor antagonist
VEIRTRQAGHVVILDLLGRLAGEGAAELEQVLRALGRAGTRTLIVNLARLRSIDFAGLGALADGRHEFAAAGGELRLAGVTRHLGDLVIITRLATMFNLYDSVEQALEGAIPTAAPQPLSAADSGTV